MDVERPSEIQSALSSLSLVVSDIENSVRFYTPIDISTINCHSAQVGRLKMFYTKN